MCDWNWTKEDFNTKIKNEPECLHKQCPECHGTGKKLNNELCVHYLSCPCPRCTPQFRST